MILEKLCILLHIFCVLQQPWLFPTVWYVLDQAQQTVSSVVYGEHMTFLKLKLHCQKLTRCLNTILTLVQLWLIYPHLATLAKLCLRCE